MENCNHAKVSSRSNSYSITFKVSMFSKFINTAAVATFFLLTGCATQTKMPFSGPDNAAVNADKSVYLMTATIKNIHRTSHQPKAIVMHVEKGEAKESADRINYTMDALAKAETDTPAGSTYYLRMELDKGEYVIRGITGMSSSFPIHGMFFTPIHAKLVPTTPGIFYLGHVEAVARKRNENEFKAGPSIPLIDQAIAGASTSTFDITISDQWASDEASFKSRFPVLNGTTIQKSILPAFDREFAQQWWAAH
ncbi:hypothetical protein [Massilia violaceinigra]|nr:hypothetical protein [Massilia violaceinigra]